MRDRVREVLRESVEEVNRQVAERHRIEFSRQTPLLGEDSKLDSLGLVSLVVAVEGKIRERFGEAVALVDADAMRDRQGAFQTLGALEDHIVRLLEARLAPDAR